MKSTNRFKRIGSMLMAVLFGAAFVLPVLAACSDDGPGDDLHTYREYIAQSPTTWNTHNGTTDADTHTDRMVLDTALRRLDSQDRQILLMKNAGMKMKEIAPLLQIPRGTASWRYARPIEQLKHWLAEDHPL